MSERKQPGEKTRLKYESKYLKRQIRQAETLLKQRRDVSSLRSKLEDLKDRVEHPERYAYEEHHWGAQPKD